MAHWQDYLEDKDPALHSVTGTLLVCKQVCSPQLGNHRDIYACLPPSYGRSDRRYPVIYMHDGQNLFDAAASFAGEWQVDEAVELLAGHGIEAIIIGIPNAGDARKNEYCPFDDARHKIEGQGDAYLSFIVDTLMPVINADFRTQPGMEYTGIAGSSMGGLVSLYALAEYPDVFGMVGAFSPALYFADRAIYGVMGQTAHSRARVYIDVGTAEVTSALRFRALGRLFSWQYLHQVRHMRDVMVHLGYTGSQLHYVEEAGGIHHETAWARRLPGALKYLLGR